jgi:hypothetical protein
LKRFNIDRIGASFFADAKNRSWRLIRSISEGLRKEKEAISCLKFFHIDQNGARFLLCKKQILAPFLINIWRLKNKMEYIRDSSFAIKIWQAAYLINIRVFKKKTRSENFFSKRLIAYSLTT